jgi:hypothetical protein
MEFTLKRWNEVVTRYPDLITNMSIISRNAQYGKILRPYLVFYVSGTNTLSTIYRLQSNKRNIRLLPGEFFNNSDISYDPSYYTRHVHTGLWGKENIDLNLKETTLRNIPLDTFDFYTDYSQGAYRHYPGVDWAKNDVHGIPTMQSEFRYE